MSYTASCLLHKYLLASRHKKCHKACSVGMVKSQVLVLSGTLTNPGKENPFSEKMQHCSDCILLEISCWTELSSVA